MKVYRTEELLPSTRQNVWDPRAGLFVIQGEEFGRVTSRVVGGSRDHKVELSQEGPSLTSVTSLPTPLLSGLVPILNTGRGGEWAGKALPQHAVKSRILALYPSTLGNQHKRGVVVGKPTLFCK